MKTEWHYFFEVRGAHFSSELRLPVVVTQPLSEEIPRKLACEVRICPDHSKPSSDFDQAGELIVELPITGQHAEAIACDVAHLLAEKISLQQDCHFRVDWEMICSRRIPETLEEERQIQGRDADIRILFQPQENPPAIDPVRLTTLLTLKTDPRLTSQYNEACRNTDVVGQFLGLFRVVESAASSENPGYRLKVAMKASKRLHSAFLSCPNELDFEEFIDLIVERRHECAHLKLDKAFGYHPLDPRTEADLRPILPILRALARACVDSEPSDISQRQ